MVDVGEADVSDLGATREYVAVGVLYDECIARGGLLGLHRGFPLVTTLGTGIARLTARAIRPFIGCRDYAVSRAFYAALGFTEVELGPAMCVLSLDGGVCFYLQDAFVEDWIYNTMLFLEVDASGLDDWHRRIEGLDLPATFGGVRLSGIKDEDWGREFFLHDPSGILWHIGCFAR